MQEYPILYFFALQNLLFTLSSIWHFFPCHDFLRITPDFQLVPDCDNNTEGHEGQNHPKQGWESHKEDNDYRYANGQRQDIPER